MAFSFVPDPVSHIVQLFPVLTSENVQVLGRNLGGTVHSLGDGTRPACVVTSKIRALQTGYRGEGVVKCFAFWQQRAKINMKAVSSGPQQCRSDFRDSAQHLLVSLHL